MSSGSARCLHPQWWITDTIFPITWISTRRLERMEDMKELIAEAKKRGIRILMDLVVNHSSDRHAWFQAALKDPFGKYGKYYVFREGKDGKEPNNWRSIFGGSAWEKVPGYDNLYYLHILHKRAAGSQLGESGIAGRNL